MISWKNVKGRNVAGRQGGSETQKMMTGFYLEDDHFRTIKS